MVGANGSGKSNVVDAIRWCLGEQSARELRAQRSEDVIYLGARHAGGRAEVELTFESTDADAPSAAETSVSRRLYRSGDSEYLVDGVRVRLRDVQDALRGIGIDGGRYVIVTQGMTDAWLSAPPAERRALLEQAAGLAMYRARREEARQKLATTSQNMQLIETVLAELEPRLRVLRRQARAVQERTDAVARLDHLLRQWYGWHWHHLADRILEAEAQLEDLTTQRTVAERTLHRLEAEAEESQLEERRHRQRRDAALAAFHAAQREHDAASFAVREAQSREAIATKLVGDLAQQLNAAKISLAESRERLDAASTERNSDYREEEERRAQIAALQREHDACREQANVARNGMQRLLGSWQQSSQRVETLQQQRESQRHRARKLDAERTEAEERFAEATNRLRTAESLIATLVPASQAAQAAHASSIDSRVRHEAEHLDAQARRDRLERLVSRLRRRSIETTRGLAKTERLLEDLEPQLEDHLITRLHIPEGWGVAVAAALGSRSVAPVDEREFPDAVDQSTDMTSLSAYLTWRQTLEPFRAPAIWADTVVKGLPPDDLHPLVGTLLVEHEDAAGEVWSRLAPLPALRIGSSPIQVITRTGVAYSAQGITHYQEDREAVRFLALREDRAALESLRVRIDRRLEGLIGSFEAASATLRDVENRAHRATVDEHSAAREAERFANRRHDAEVDVQGAREMVARWADRRDRIESEALKMATSDEAVDETIEVARSELQQAETELHDAREELSGIDRARAQIENQINVETARLRASEAARKAHAALLASVRSEVARLDGVVSNLESRLSQGRDDSESSREHVALQCARLEQLHCALDRQNRQLAEIGEAPENTPARLPALQDARRRLAQLVGDSERIDAQVGALKEDRSRLLDEIAREIRTPVAALPRDVSELPDAGDLRKLRIKATQYPDADVEVLDECAQLEERYLQLRTHLGDIEAAAGTLGEVMAAADREMQSRFQSAFEAVNQEFNRVFQVMLRGGWARLEVIDAEGGIGIQAQLPGKRAQSAATFSGGERALLASSLLFGVLRIRPTPFCVLDEVDAALDESNVDRYLAALRDISRNTQIIVVTHNRATMAAADVLYGLTMSDEGVSGLLSLRLDAYQSAG